MYNFLLAGLGSFRESCDVEFLGSFTDPVGRREVKTVDRVET